MKGYTSIKITTLPTPGNIPASNPKDIPNNIIAKSIGTNSIIIKSQPTSTLLSSVRWAVAYLPDRLCVLIGLG